MGGMGGGTQVLNGYPLPNSHVGAEAVNAKIQGQSTPLKPKKWGW